jgi:hypothetical protein
MTVPTPSGNQPFTTQITQALTGTRAQQIAQVANILRGNGDGALVHDWQTYAAQHPSIPVGQAADAFLLSDALIALRKGIQGTGTFVGGSVPKAAANAANKAGNQTAAFFNPLNPGSWLPSIGGMVASAIEGGIVALFKDLWKVIGGALEIAAGVLIVVVTLGLAFRNDVAGAAAMVV